MRSSGERCSGLSAAARRPALGPAVGQDCGVHRARRRAGNRDDAQPLFLEQTVEHAPGEGAVRAAALQRQIDRQRIGNCLHARACRCLKV
jgi:hypothetical protein